MLEKKYRLKTKDVLFLTKKRQFFAHGLFGFFYITQYSNLPYNQASFHVTIKYNKHSTERNILKRALILRLQKNDFTNLILGNKYYKLFIIINKNKLEVFQKQVANKDKKTIMHVFQEYFTQSFTALQQHL